MACLCGDINRGSYLVGLECTEHAVAVGDSEEHTLGVGENDDDEEDASMLWTLAEVRCFTTVD